jgi:type VI secretion system secreted protein VgrG
MLARSDAPRHEERISSVSSVDSTVSPFELRAGPYESSALTVVSLRGREAISEPFSFEITVAASPDVDDSTIEADVLGAPACLVMQAGASGPRFARGVVAEVSAQSAVHGGRAVYRLQLVPALSLLKLQTTSRVFQEKTVPEIVAAVLDEAGLTYALRLLGKYRPRTYCVQHRETDFAFVERLLAEEGIFYTFDHGGPDAESEIVSLSDTAHFYPTIDGDPELAYRPHGEGVAGMALGEHHVQRFDLRRSLRPTSVLRRGYDFRRPALALTAEAKLELVAGGEPLRGEIYEHHEEDEEPNIRQETVAAELEQHRVDVEVGRGASGCRRLVPGARFKLCDHDLGRLDAEYVVTSVAHEGRAPETTVQGEPVYSNTFECVPAAVTARPVRQARSLQQVTETALVVGPEGQEIYTDEHGRVKVQFHWDREGRRDEQSSCWIRVAQTWAGSGWGFQFVPRIGMEVVVTFLGGDVDRPLITGCVPNAINLPPYRLPESKTQSGIRTHSSPGGEGFNELMFEDQAGAEQIRIHAERDLLEIVEHNRAIRVGGDESIAVMGAVSRCVGGAVDERIAGDRAQRIAGSDRREIVGASEVTARGDVTTQVRGCHTTVVGTAREKRSYVLHVEGLTQVSGTGMTEITSEKGIVLRCGESALRITPAGIEIVASSFSARGAGGGLSIDGDTLRLQAKEHAQICATTVLLKSPKASIKLHDDAQIDGKRVLLNSPASAKDPVVDKSPKVTTIELVDQKGKPLAHQRYLVVLEDGSEVTGFLNDKGRAVLELDATAGAITFPGLRHGKAA